MFRIKNKHGQSTLEYAVLVIIIIGALLTIQMYFKRAAQGKMGASADQIGDQFSPGNMNSVKTTKTYSKTTEEFGINGQGVSKSSIQNESTNTTENTSIINTEYEYWGK